MDEAGLKASFRLYLITDRHLATRSGGLLHAVEAALAGAAEIAPSGTVALQLREKDLCARELYEFARALRARCLRFGVPLIVNDRVDVAIAAGADGVHLPSDSFEVKDARELLGPERLIGVSTHVTEEVAAARRRGADFVVFGPVYDPVSKAAYGPAKGVAALGDAVKAAGTMPVYALGGITASTVPELASMELSARPQGVAVIGAVFGASAPDAAAAELVSLLTKS
jgi:thiamine-phosphate pyrophosphorylase